MNDSLVAVVVDLVRSRDLQDRVGAQSAVRDVFDCALSGAEVVQPLVATVGDEFQIVFADLPSALRTTALVRLHLPHPVDCRFGFGRGEITNVESRSGVEIQDGSAWWRAREAIDEARRREGSGDPYLRGWFVGDPSASEFVLVVNSLLLLRDRIITAMRPRDRRITAGLLRGRSQAEIARTEEISQSAVSQSLQRSGAAVMVAANQLFAAEGASGGRR